MAKIDYVICERSFTAIARNQFNFKYLESYNILLAQVNSH